MNTIIKFLKDNLTVQPIDEQINVAKQDIDKLNQLFASHKITLRKNSQTHIKPKANQVWAVKSEYYDFLGKKQTTSHPFLVSLLTDIENYEEENFMRVAVISPFTEMATQQDEICNDASIVGFPFLVETWNNQPILTEILEEYIGYFEPKEVLEKEEKLSALQQQFREVEIAKAKYLNNSVSALVGFVELNQRNEFSAVITANGQAIFGGCLKNEDEFISNEPTIELPSEDNTLAKTTFIKKLKSISLKDEQLPFEIQIKKSEDSFILSAFTTEEITLFDFENKNITPISNSERQVFSNLKKGLYTLKAKNIQEAVKIRLK